MRVKPAPGLKVRDPITLRHLPEAGREVPESQYWMRRLADGDVVRIDESVESVLAPDSEQAPAEEN